MTARRPMGALSALLVFVLIGSRVPAADPPEPDRPVAPGFQREKVHLILIDVVVTDKEGNSVAELRPEEFSLWVDGKPHAINSVELRRIGEGAPAVPGIPAERGSGQPPEGGMPGAARVF